MRLRKSKSDGLVALPILAKEVGMYKAKATELFVKLIEAGGIVGVVAQ